MMCRPLDSVPVGLPNAVTTPTVRAGTTTVKSTFDQIFRREGITAVSIEGDAFHRYDRAAMKAELAARLGLEPRTISELMTELAGINAITRRKEGRRVIYAMNPNVATHIAGPEARKAARDAAGPLLTLMEGGKT